MTPAEFRKVVVDLKLSQKRLADALGKDVSTIRRYATGKTPVPQLVEFALRHFSDLPKGD